MQQSTTIQLTLGELYTVIAIVGALLGVATVYLRLYLASALSKTKDDIIQGIEVKFVTREVVKLEFREIHRRLDRAEGGDSGVRKRREVVDDE